MDSASTKGWPDLPDIHTRTAEEPVTVPLIPTSLRTSLLHQHHDAPQAGHLGPDKTAGRIQQVGYWVGMLWWILHRFSIPEGTNGRGDVNQPLTENLCIVVYFLILQKLAQRRSAFASLSFYWWIIKNSMGRCSHCGHDVHWESASKGDKEVFLHRPIPWRSARVTQMLKYLDSRVANNQSALSSCCQRKRRIATDEPSSQPKPTTVSYPPWAFNKYAVTIFVMLLFSYVICVPFCIHAQVCFWCMYMYNFN